MRRLWREARCLVNRNFRGDDDGGSITISGGFKNRAIKANNFFVFVSFNSSVLCTQTN